MRFPHGQRVAEPTALAAPKFDYRAQHRDGILVPPESRLPQVLLQCLRRFESPIAPEEGSLVALS